MSVDKVKLFFKKVESDSLLQQKMKELATKYKGKKEAGVAELVSLAAEIGIEFTAADFFDAKSQAEELSQEEVVWLAKRFEQMGECGWPPCGGAAYTCPKETW